MASPDRPDQIKIQSLSLHLPNGLGPSSFNLTPPPPCAINLTLTLTIDPLIIPRFATDDTFTPLSINYSTVSKSIYALINSRSWSNVGELTHAISGDVLAVEGVEGVDVDIEIPRASLVGLVSYHTTSNSIPKGKGKAKANKEEEEEGDIWRCKVGDMRPILLIGLHPHERTAKQPLHVDITLSGPESKIVGIHHTLATEAFNVSGYI
jgi:dihydroneopterin aldolase/2-amino-4-hydroxy-6-hydroxymethyldihydropteridine diphosphokinase/dihydropteroate synthase